MSELVPTTQPAQPALRAEFQRLTDALAAERTRLAHWQEASSSFQQQLAAAAAPARAKLRVIDTELLRFLDRTADQAGLGRSDLRLLHALIRDLAAALLRDGEDVELRALYQRYAHDDAGDGADDGAGRDAPEDEPAPAVSSAAADEDWMAAWERMEAEQHDAAHARQRQREQHKAQAHRQRRAALPTPEDGSQTLRSVYRKLASALHPDREPDPVERRRKTALMQRANRAYDNKSLVDLLQLQLETAQIGQDAVAAMGEDALRRSNAVLAEQLDDLRQEVVDTERAFRTLTGLGHGAEPTPVRLARAIREQVRALQQDIAYYEWERQELEDARFFKQWLREQG